MLFWIISALIIIGSALIVALPILRAKMESRDSAASDLDVYKDQLKELESDVGRGVLSVSEAETSRTEIARRLLAASDAQDDAPRPAPRGLSKIAALCLLGFTAAGTLFTYSYIGAPGTPDQPLASRPTEAPRPTQEEFEIEVAETLGDQRPQIPEREAQLLAQLEVALQDRPNELQGHQLLANTLNSLQQYDLAWRAQQDVLRILGDDANSDDFADLAEMMVFAAGRLCFPKSGQRASAVSSNKRRKPTGTILLWNLDGAKQQTRNCYATLVRTPDRRASRCTLERTGARAD